MFIYPYEIDVKSLKTLKLHQVIVDSLDVAYYDDEYVDKMVKQYNSLVHIFYNQLVDNPKFKYKDAREKFDTLNNMDLMDSYFINAAYHDAKALYKRYNKGKRAKNPLGHKLIFGGKQLFKNRAKGLITKEEFIKKRLRPLTVIGEANRGGNGRFKIRSHRYIDFVRDGKVILTFRITDKRCGLLGKLKKLQDNYEIALTFKLERDYIYITYNSALLETKEYDVFSNRFMALDLNPGCIGVTILDIDLEDKCSLKPKFSFAIEWDEILKKHIVSKSSSDSETNKYYNNKRIHEIKEVNKLIFQLAVQYHCRFIVCEDLEFKCSKGRKMANLWNRELTIKSLQSRCDRSNIKLLKINPAYTSKLGNILCKHNVPDMCRSATEIGYRAYRGIEEGNFNLEGTDKHLYIHGLKEFKDFIIKSLEERGTKVKDETLKKIKKAKDIKKLNEIFNSYGFKYRVSMKECESNDTVYIYKTDKSFIKIHSYKIDNEELNYLVS